MRSDYPLLSYVMIRAKLRTTCPLCGEVIEVGALAAYRRSQTTSHAECVVLKFGSRATFIAGPSLRA